MVGSRRITALVGQLLHGVPEDTEFSGIRTLAPRPRHADTLCGVPVLSTFDFNAFIAAADSERRKQELRWVDLADALWDQSAYLNAHRNDHPL